ncbi:hypothetical protein [Kitasatospora sp. GAS204B]|uniref:hypothetical protein n=1 Tax=unclassified Kitasatospora TaxID=2633591 RepID=UPI0024747657|nr:hypothetical protein [Kitasatospora sp. GAS204B]
MTTLSLSLAGVITAGVALLGVSFAATTPPAAPPAQPNPNCTLRVPANPLTAQGLATPYRLTATDPAQGACHESNANQSAFVQATVIDPGTGTISVYDPLVIDNGSTPAAAPVVPTLPANAVVGIWFGYNGNTLTLAGHTAAGNCVGGVPGGQPFGQFAYCDAPAFFTAADTAEGAGRLTVPPLGTAKDGRPCLTTRDFGLVDQDQSDNVTTEYLATTQGTIAQKTAKNGAALGGGATMQPAALLNGSDNLLLDNFEDPALGCTPWTAPDLADPGSMVTSLALNELQAAKFQADPVAVVPLNDPMVTENNQQSRNKTNLYRAGVDQPALGATANGDPAAYCTDLATVGTRRINLDKPFTSVAASPQNGQTLFDFLTQRLAASLTNLGCQQAGSTPTATPTASASASATAVPTAMPTSTGLPTAMPTSSAAPTTGSTPTSSAAPTTGSTPTASAAPTTPAGGCTPAQLLADPGFEAGTAPPWQATPFVIDNSGGEPPHSGTWDAWLDGYLTPHTDTVSQQVTIPAGCKASLSFWLHVNSATPNSTADTLTVVADSTTLATYSDRNSASGYQQKTLDLSALAGRTVTLTFTGVEAKGSSRVSFVLDDTALNVS